jgi:TatD DNase family protein
MLVDSHCHLNYKGMAEQQGDLLDRARASGVTAMLNISTRASEWDAVTATAHREADVWASIGIHPHEADTHIDVDTARLVARAESDDRVVGIGETGLDYYYDHSDREQQRRSFIAHIAASRATGLPLIIHTRDAEDDTAAILADEMGKGAFPALIHCFTRQRRFRRQGLGNGPFHLDLGHRDVQERQGPAGSRTRTSRRPASRRDRRAVPGPGPASRQAGRTRVCR